jgi:hypothetical protein
MVFTGTKVGNGMIGVCYLCPITANGSRLFIVDGVISLPIALVGFWMIPDVPEISKPWYLTDTVSSQHRYDR